MRMYHAGMTTKQELEDEIRAKLRKGMTREDVQRAVQGVLAAKLPKPEISVEDTTTDEDAAQRRLKATIHVKNPSLDWAARALAEVPGTKLKIAQNLVLQRWEVPADAKVGDGEYWGDPDADGAGATGPDCMVCRLLLAAGDLVVNEPPVAAYYHADCYMRVEKARQDGAMLGLPLEASKDGAL